MIAIQEIRSLLEKMPSVFDSHEFILNFIQYSPCSYGALLVAHNNVALAHAEISNFLRNNSAELGIAKTNEKESTDIFGKLTECAVWAKI